MKATKSNSKLVTMLVPTGLLASVDDASDRSDSDRSKWVREAIREKLGRENPALTSQLEGVA